MAGGPSAAVRGASDDAGGKRKKPKKPKGKKK
jgi:hypothetical protein